MKQVVLFNFFIIVGICGLLALGNMAANDEQLMHHDYCEMVGLWEEDAAAGVIEPERRGWPNYKRLECN